MPTLVARLYDSKAKLTEVVEALKEAEYTDEEMTIISKIAKSDSKKKKKADEEAPVANASESSDRAAFESLDLSTSARAVYAEHLGKGKVLLAVNAKFMKAQKAIDIMDSFQPVPVQVPNQDQYITRDHSGSIIRQSYRPAMLTKGEKFMTSTYFPGLTEGRWLLSMLFNLPMATETKRRYPLITGKGTLISNMLGMPTIKRSGKKDSVISGDTRPFSSALKSSLGVPVVIGKTH